MKITQSVKIVIAKEDWNITMITKIKYYNNGKTKMCILKTLLKTILN